MGIKELLVRVSPPADAPASYFIHCLVLVQPRKAENRPDMTPKLLTGT